MVVGIPEVVTFKTKEEYCRNIKRIVVLGEIGMSTTGGGDGKNYNGEEDGKTGRGKKERRQEKGKAKEEKKEKEKKTRGSERRSTSYLRAASWARTHLTSFNKGRDYDLIFASPSSDGVGKTDKEMVYLLEYWVNDKLMPSCSYNSCGKFTRTFQTKWVWDEGEGWHTITYIHKSKRA